MKKSFFIAIDGIDGSGKSELVKMLYRYLLSKKYDVMETREPSDWKYGEQIRKMLREESNPMSNSNKLMELFIKDRQEHLTNTIEPFLKNVKNKKKVVICDRYYYSTIAFQGAQGLDFGSIIKKNKRFRKPDIAFILDVKPEIALKRIKYRKKEKFERIDFMRKIRENFLKLPSLLSDNIKVIDSSKPLKDVFGNVKKEINKILD